MQGLWSLETGERCQYHMLRRTTGTHNHAVIPGEDGEVAKSGDKIPPGSDITCKEDPESEDRNWVHIKSMP